MKLKPSVLGASDLARQAWLASARVTFPNLAQGTVLDPA
jgi:hypothetical protein